MPFFNNLSSLFGPRANQQDRKHRPKTQKNSNKSKSAADATSQPVRQVEVTPLKQAGGGKFSRQGAKGAADPKLKSTANAQTTSGPISPNNQAQLDSLVREAQARAREIIVEAKGEALAIRERTEKQERELVAKLENQQRDLNTKLDRIDARLSQIDDREVKLENDRARLVQTTKQLEEQKAAVTKKLEEVASLTRDEAKTALMADMESKLSRQLAQFIRQKEEEARETADEKVQEILTDAMKHGATDYVAEYTISTVNIPSEEIKGKIIGKNGRNIHTFEKYTGVDLDLDTSPTEVRLSCFDPVRREVARIALERLIKDGRIQPTRIEEVVNKVRGEIDKITFEAGKKLCHEVGIYNLPPDLMKMLGKFKYRFSYGQNLIAHTLEETKIGIKIAHELKADVNVVKMGCLLHDIGKVSDEEDGSHVELGVKIAKKFGLPQPVIDCIAQHHEDEPFTGVDQMIVYIADAISGARPGARYENYEGYVKRLQDLEAIARQYDTIKQAYAIQAGREIRVQLDPERTKDSDVQVLAVKIRDEIKEKLTYPGTVTVSVSRETTDQKVAT